MESPRVERLQQETETTSSGSGSRFFSLLGNVVTLIWFPVLLITALHYITPPELHWIHDVLRRTYYLPIIYASFRYGLGGGLISALLITVVYLPHAFLHVSHTHIHPDPAYGIEKFLEMVLYHVVGGVTGHLADLEQKRSRQLERALQERERLTSQLVRAGRLGALGEVVAGIAHEIRNPLHSLLATAEIIDPLVPHSAPERAMWDVHVDEIKRLDRTAGRFLSFAKPSVPKMEPLDLRALPRRVRELVGADARQRGVDLVVEEWPEPVMVRGDRDQLVQVAMNVVLNGLKAITTHGRGSRLQLRVGIRLERGGGQRLGTLEMENDGPPIPEDQLEHLFDPFHTGYSDGAGLGLSISSRIAESHGGFLEAVNGGIGVRFTLSLPLDT